MNTFEGLPEEKRRTIVNAGYTCFGKNGYDKASMADIAKLARVSKASLFHYFGTKKAFYQYLYAFGAQKIISALGQKIGETSDDFFERMYHTQALKMDVIEDYPAMYDFYATSVYETDEEAAESAKEPYGAYIQEGYAALFEGVDYGRFKEGTDIEMVQNMITWVCEGYIKGALHTKSHEEMQRDIFAYLHLIKQAVYKEAYL
ncbi:TetR/AcrR family transcriptional regulator [Ruminococcaceae bacterium OttesenSCG-928-I18]|nr:TetR/AcrR family transcriptional regulator [Ruminococcaceae bacterium OttesenSCG-928-I18]